MKENMQKIWQWFRDRKTHTIRKWRSTLVRRSTENGIQDARDKRVGDMITRELDGVTNSTEGHSVSDINLPSTSRELSPEYEQFFDEPRTKDFLDVRRQSFREQRSDSYSFPVIPPDLDDGWIERSNRQPTESTPSTHRSPRQIRFQIPEIQVELSPSSSPQGSSQQLSNEPPAEIEWSPARQTMDTVVPKPVIHSNPSVMQEIDRLKTSRKISVGSDSALLTKKPYVKGNGGLYHRIRKQSFIERNDSLSASLDEAYESSSSPRRNSSNERARQNLLAQRRQSQIQLVQEMSGRQTTTTLIPLTCAQIHLVRSLWRQIYTSKGPTVIGSSIYHRLCFKCPQVKEQIRRVSLPQKFLNHDSFIKAHSKAIGELIDQVVDNLDNLDNMADELIRVGQAHAKLLRGELTGKLWNVVAETFIDCTLEWGDRRCRSETVRKAWALIVAFVIEKIKLGHHEQRKKMLATRQSLPAIQVPFKSMKI